MTLPSLILDPPQKPQMNIIRMNPHAKEVWLAALRSDEYAQTTGTLHDSEGFCCLGVLCDLYKKEHPDVAGWTPADPTSVRGHNFFDTRTPDELATKLVSPCMPDNAEFLASDILPGRVMAWAGLQENDPDVEDEEGDANSLSSLNDHGADFNSISLFIETSL
jgi:hypothetical protein